MEPIILTVDDPTYVEVIALHPERLRFEEAGLCGVNVTEGNRVTFVVYFRGEDYRMVDAVFADYGDAARNAIPVVGMGATMMVGTDRYPYTVVDVLTPKKIVVQEDHAVLVAGSAMSESQEYEYAPNPNARRITLRKRADGLWGNAGEASGPVQVGHRRAYSDPTF